MISDRDGMTLVFVPAGEFVMGTTNPTPLESDEAPQRTVTLDGFWIDKTEVTNAMYAKCVQAGKCAKSTSTNFAAPDYADHPVVSVLWEEARVYCEWAGRRLPTEAEWEKAARGTDGRLYPWGNEPPDTILGQATTGAGDTLKVGSLSADASPYGVLDTFSNVRQWVADWYAPDYYTNSPSENPPGPSSGHLGQRAIRGGVWGAPPNRDYLANRSGAPPDVRSAVIGFRCALTP
jgi:formylglycine-generating enzyme required for sulfatase activity